MIVGIHHCTLGVRDLGRSISFYRDVLGFAVAWEGDSTWEDVSAETGRPEVKSKSVWLRRGETILELIESSPRDDALSFSWPRGIGFNHFGLRVTDIENVCADAAAKGLKFFVPASPGASGVVAAFAKDPDGNLIEFFQDPGDLESEQ